MSTASRLLKILLVLLNPGFIVNAWCQGPIFEKGYEIFFEKVDDTTFVWERYDALTERVVESVTYSTEHKVEKHGAYFRGLPNGRIISQGAYFWDLKEGEWTEKIGETGNYKKGKREGNWVTFDHLDRVIAEQSYKNGKLHGASIFYDSEGKVISEGEYELDSLISGNGITGSNLIFPVFQGCDRRDFEDEQSWRACGDRAMLMHIYQNIRYPTEAHENGLEGQVVIRMTIDSEGNVQNPYVVKSVTQSLDQESLRVVSEMPNFNPATRGGVPVSVEFHLPISFRLN